MESCVCDESCLRGYQCCIHYLNPYKTNVAKPYKVIELFSGIGGMHYAFHASGIAHEVVAAVDINTVANHVYLYNFAGASHLQRNIQSLRAEEVDSLNPDIITMSPPCQPFSRLGLQQDINDPRTKAFLHILELFPKLKKKPSYILIENVKGFEVSFAQKLLTQMLTDTGYVFQEFLFSPAQFGIPNSRLRYYLLAKLNPLEFSFTRTHEVEEDASRYFSSQITSFPLWLHEKLLATKSKFDYEGMSYVRQNVLPLSLFIEDKPETYFEDYLLPDKLLTKYAMVLDIVNETDTHSCCFTKAYGHYARGTGSVLHFNTDVNLAEVFEYIQKLKSDTPEYLESLKKLKLRYFTPREIANIMCFPQNFEFPDYITIKQKYCVLGNSVNITVVSELLKLLIKDSAGTSTSRDVTT